MAFKRVFSISVIWSLVKILSIFAVNKVLAIYTGVSGFAVVGQLQNFVQIILAASTAGAYNGVVSIASKNNDVITDDQDRLSETFIYFVVSSIIVGLVLVSLAPFAAEMLLGDVKYAIFLFVLAVFAVFYSLGQWVVAVLNGKKDYFGFFLVNAVGSVSSVAVVALLTTNFGLDGAFVALVTYQSTIFVTALFYAKNSHQIRKHIKLIWISKKALRELLGFSVMGLVTAIVGPLLFIFARTHLIDIFSPEVAGLWEAVWRLSSGYMFVVTTSLSTYFVPLFASSIGKERILNETLSGLVFLIPGYVLAAFVLYVFRFDALEIAYSASFVSAEKFVLLQLIGDFVKTIALVFSFSALAKRNLRAYLLGELIFGITFVLFVVFLGEMIGSYGVGWAYLVSYLFFLIYHVMVFNKEILKN